MKNCKFNVSHFNPEDRKTFREIAEQTNFDIEKIGRRKTRDKSPIKLPNSPAIMALGFSTIFSQEIPNELCDRIKLLLQENKVEIIFIYLMKKSLL